MNYSRIQAFVPDYRHVLWPERYRNRMGLFCFLFPGYPNQDYPFGWRACDEELEPDPALVTIHDPRLRTQILPVYRIGYAAAPGKPFSVALKEAAARYGWPIVVATDNASFLRTDVPSLPGVVPLAREDGPADALVIRVTPARAGPHVLVLGGRRLEERLTRLQLDGARSRWRCDAAATGPWSTSSSRRAPTGSSCPPSTRRPTHRPTTSTSPRS